MPKYIQTHTTQGRFVNLMTSRQAKLQEDIYFRVVHVLQYNSDLTLRELEEKLGISVGGLNYCLGADGTSLVEMKNFANSKNKFSYVYVLTLTAIAGKATTTHGFLQRKMNEYKALRAGFEALMAEVGDDEADGLRKVGQ